MEKFGRFGHLLQRQNDNLGVSGNPGHCYCIGVFKELQLLNNRCFLETAIVVIRGL